MSARLLPNGTAWRFANKVDLIDYLTVNRIDPDRTPLDTDIMEFGRNVVLEQYVPATADEACGCGCGFSVIDGMMVTEDRVFPKRRGWWDPKPLRPGLIKGRRR